MADATKIGVADATKMGVANARVANATQPTLLASKVVGEASFGRPGLLESQDGWQDIIIKPRL